MMDFYRKIYSNLEFSFMMVYLILFFGATDKAYTYGFLMFLMGLFLGNAAHDKSVRAWMVVLWFVAAISGFVVLVRYVPQSL